jgi:hypothetical protein
VAAVVQSAASDWAATRLAIAIERVAEAMLIEEEAPSCRRVSCCAHVRDYVYSYNCDW